MKLFGFFPDRRANSARASCRPTPRSFRDGPRDVVTNCEDTFYLPVIAVGPERAPRTCIDQLRRYAHVLIGALYAALDDVLNIEVLSHLPTVRGLGM